MLVIECKFCDKIFSGHADEVKEEFNKHMLEHGDISKQRLCIKCGRIVHPDSKNFCSMSCYAHYHDLL